MRLILPLSRLILLLAALSLLAGAGAVRSIRIETRTSTTPNGKSAAALYINDELVVQLAKEQYGKTPLELVTSAAAQLARAYRKGRGDMYVKPADDSGRRYVLYLNGEALLLATDEEGKAWGADPQKLAGTWLSNVDHAWRMSKPALQTTPGEQAPRATPSAAAPPSGGLLDVPAPRVNSDPDYAKLVVTSFGQVYEPPGATTVSQPLSPAKLTAHVTGRSTPSQAIWASVENALRVYSNKDSSVNLRWQEVVEAPAEPAPLTIGPGKQRKIRVAFTLDGTDPAASANIVDLTLVNDQLAIPRETLTFFSNKPEGVAAPQLLYYAELPAGQAGRLVLHHQNQSRGELKLLARLVNTSDELCAVHIVPGTCAPDINTFFVGFRSAEVFWQNLSAGNGYVLAIPPHRQALITNQRLQEGFTASGYFKLTNLSRQKVRLETVCMDPWMLPPEAPLSSEHVASKGVYPAPYVNISQRYDIGNDWLYLRLGKESPDSLVDDSRLDGSYGVTYTFSVELHNPTEAPALIFAVLRASAGEVKGQFFIDDQYIVTPLVASGEEQLLKEIPLKPGQTKLLTIKALPLNGGFYPASIILRESRYP